MINYNDERIIGYSDLRNGGFCWTIGVWQNKKVQILLSFFVVTGSIQISNQFVKDFFAIAG